MECTDIMSSFVNSSLSESLECRGISGMFVKVLADSKALPWYVRLVHDSG